MNKTNPVKLIEWRVKVKFIFRTTNAFDINPKFVFPDTYIEILLQSSTFVGNREKKTPQTKKYIAPNISSVCNRMNKKLVHRTFSNANSTKKYLLLPNVHRVKQSNTKTACIYFQGIQILLFRRYILEALS